MSHKDGVQNNSTSRTDSNTLIAELQAVQGGLRQQIIRLADVPRARRRSNSNFAQWRPLNKNPENLEPLFPESEATVGFL